MSSLLQLLSFGREKNGRWSSFTVGVKDSFSRSSSSCFPCHRHRYSRHENWLPLLPMHRKRVSQKRGRCSRSGDGSRQTSRRQSNSRLAHKSTAGRVSGRLEEKKIPQSV